MGISSDLSAARPGAGIAVWVAFTEAHSVQSTAPGSMHLVSGFGNPGREGSPAAPCPNSGWVPCLGCLSDWPSADRWVDSNKPSLISHVGTIKDVEIPLLRQPASPACRLGGGVRTLLCGEARCLLSPGRPSCAVRASSP